MTEKRFVFFGEYAILEITEQLIGVEISTGISIAANKGFNKKGEEKMTQGKATVFETDVLLFSVKTDAKEVSTAEKKTEVVEVEKTTLRIDINKRFARLRKSMRKRSASIF